MVGKTAGGAVMYHAMHSLGFAAESSFAGTPKLGQARPGATVVVLGAGLAGMTAAYELRKAGYRVKLLEYGTRAGGRCWTIRGGDRFADLSGESQSCTFARGNYFNPGPWRIPYHHHAVMHYCREFGVTLEPFVQTNYNALLHNKAAFGGKPQRFRHVQADFHGHVAELLGKAANQGALDGSLTKEDKEKLLESLRHWGALDSSMRYSPGPLSSARRGFDIDPAGGLMPKAMPSTPIGTTDLLQSNLWRNITAGEEYEYSPAIFQPAGGMDAIAKAFEKRLKREIVFDAKVTKIEQDSKGVKVTYVNSKKPSAESVVTGDWCVCTIPLSILNQMETLSVSDELRAAIAAVPYAESYKAAFECKRRFWEEDDKIYGGISYTNLPISRIAYPCDNPGAKGPGVLLAAYTFGVNAYEFSAKPHAERMKYVTDFASQLHPQLRSEIASGIDIAWHRVPFTLGCYGLWTPEAREQHYDRLCTVDGRFVIAGEHASYLPAWQEGAVLSAISAIERLHSKATA